MGHKKGTLGTVETFLGALPEWVNKRYIHNDIWKELRDYIDDDLLTPEKLHLFLSNAEKRNQAREKMSKGDHIPFYIISVVSRYVDSSKFTNFALKHLGLHATHIEMIRENYLDEKRRNFEVK